MRILIVFIFSMMWVGGPRSSAQTPAHSGAATQACKDATTTAAMRSCENDRYLKAQKNLDAIYEQLLAKLDTPGKAKLRIAQQAWKIFRAANADFQADSGRGGSLAPLIRITTLADMTEARTTELMHSSN